MNPSPEIGRPQSGECPEEPGRYATRVPGEDAWPALVGQVAEVERRLGALPEERALHRYAAGKWSVKEVVGHLADAERIYAYRALRFARNDPAPLPGFDENRYVPEGRFDGRPLRSLLDEWLAVRAATLALYRWVPAAALARCGVANGLRVSVRALAWVAAGHTLHHLDVLRERYGC